MLNIINIEIMDTSSLILGLVFLVIIILPIIFLARASKKKNNQNENLDQYK
ncbi:MAG: hypothetical protein BWX59_00180 [Bacteroidetes bacterium ADurb.Bin028]|jgi:heme/copper-type cytochrome/quinol oxidase subunit 2|nr:MAG: hypothetical protein BWX59_00180 [Bacteroidetes bacterium ADurb.Bin028]